MFYSNDHMDLHLSEEFWIAADALAGHRLMHSPSQQQVGDSKILYQTTIDVITAAKYNNAERLFLFILK